MKTSLSFFKKVALFGAAALVFAACQKEQITGNGGKNKPASITSEQKRELIALGARVPSVVRVYDENDHRFIDVDFRTKQISFREATERDFSFATTTETGWNFSNSDDVSWQAAENGGGILFVGAGAFGANAGGTVVAGSTALDVNYTFCFTATDEALGLDLFDTGADLEGISGVIGIAGDFEALVNDEVDADSDFTDYFQGFAAYFVYDDEAQGSYEILNWLNDLESEPDDLADRGFSYVFGFEDGSFYLSSDGTMNVSGGTMTFSGDYWGIEGLFDELFSEDGGYDDAEVVDVPGFGSMGCN